MVDWPWALPKGQVTLVVGRPGSGKTSLLLSLVAHAACDERRPTVLLSGELPRAAAACRILAGLTGVPPREALAAGKLDPSLKPRLDAGFELLEQARLLIVDNGTTIQRDLERVLERHEVELLAVDGLSLVEPAGHPGARLRWLWRRAREWGLPVVATLSLPASTGRPRLEDVEELGVDLAFAGQVVGLLPADERSLSDPDAAGLLELRVPKDRSAAATDLFVRWEALEGRPRPPGERPAATASPAQD